jgi:hypothetical protein
LIGWYDHAPVGERSNPGVIIIVELAGLRRRILVCGNDGPDAEEDRHAPQKNPHDLLHSVPV